MKFSLLAAAVACAALFGGAAEAARYKLIRATDVSATVADSLTMTRSGSVVKLWEAKLFPKTHMPPSKRFSYDQIVAQLEYDWAGRRFRSGQENAYLKGSLTNAGETGWTQWDPIVPDSVGEATLMALCDPDSKPIAEFDTISAAMEVYQAWLASEQ